MCYNFLILRKTAGNDTGKEEEVMIHQKRKLGYCLSVMLILSMILTSIAVYGQETSDTEQASNQQVKQETVDNSLVKASNTKVSVNKSYYKQTMYGNTKTYFTFTIGSGGSVEPSIWILKDYAYAYGWEPSFEFRIVNASNHNTRYMAGTARVEEKMIGDNNGLEYMRITLGKTRLPAGTYALEAESYKMKNHNVPISFNIKYVNESGLSSVESEFNNTRNTADVISRNKTYQGNSNYKDYDYYKVSIPSTRDTTITLKTHYDWIEESGAGDENKRARNNSIELLDANGNVIISDFGYLWDSNSPTIDSNGMRWAVVSQTKRLAAGTYYVRIQGDESYVYDHYENGYSQKYESTRDYYFSVTDDSAFTRIAGTDRYETALQIADVLKGKIGSGGKFQNVVVACGENYPDALAGSYLAKKKNAPVLLVPNGGSREDQIASYIQANISSSGTVYILGDEGVVSKRFYNKVAGFQGSSRVKRLGGIDRYDTNDKILREAGMTSSDRDMMVCTGNGYADSLAASALGKPILLVDRGLTTAQRQYLSNGSIKNIYLVGGDDVISNSTMNAIKNCNYSASVSRLEGSTRYGTSVAVARKFFSGKSSNVVVAYGENFPDGLAGGPLAMATGNPLLLGCNTSSAMSPVINFATSQGTSGGYVLGGARLVDSSMLNRMIGR